MKRLLFPALLLALLLALGVAHFSPVWAAAVTAAQISCPTAIDAATLAASLTGATLLPEEVAYLATAPTAFSYDSRIPTAYVRSTAADGELTVVARPYTTLASDGHTVRFIPTVLQSAEGEEARLEGAGERYTASLPLRGADTRFTVVYQAQVIFTAAEVMQWGNRAWEAAREADGLMQAYEEACRLYTADLRAWEAYQEAYARYEEEEEAYALYLAAQYAYEQRCQAYTAYLTAWEAYEVASAAYTAYLTEQEAYEVAYSAYLLALQQAVEDEAALSHYLQYLAVRQACEDKLTALSYILEPDYGIYAALMGDTVTEVLQRRTELYLFGCAPEDIDRAGEATERLRAWLSAYAALPDTEAQYNYYAAHADTLRTEWGALYRALYSLFDNTVLQSAMQSQGKLRRYMQFVGQLYVVYALLDDSTALDPAFSMTVKLAGMGGSYDLATMLDGLSPLPQDTNTQAPGELTWPEPLEEELPAALPQEPQKPLPLQRPDRPEPVSPPGDAPVAQEEPIAPAPVAHPGAEPQSPVTEEPLRTLLGAYRAGRLTERHAEEDATLTLTTTYTAGIAADGRITVNFYEEDGRTLLAYVCVPAGQAVTYPLAVPEKADDATYTYTFAGFVQEDGATPADLSAPTASCTVYASYQAIHRQMCTITWCFGEVQYKSSARYGTTPVCPFSVARADTVEYRYEFLGWSPALETVTADATYTAQYRAVPRTYTIRFQLYDGTVLPYAVPYGETPTPPEVPDVPDGALLYRFTGWDTAITPVTGEALYVARYAPLSLGRCAGDDVSFSLLDGTLTLSPAGAAVQCSTALAYAAERGYALVLEWDGLSLSFSREAVAACVAAQVEQVSLAPISVNGSAAACRVTLYATGGAPLDAFPADLILQWRYDAHDPEDAEWYRVAESGESSALIASYRQGMLYVPIRTGGDYAVYERFPLVTDVGGSGSGAVAPNVYRAAAGTRVSLSLSPGIGSYLVTLRVTTRITQEPVPLDADNSFLMPQDGVCISATFAPCRYTVQFYWDGELLRESSYAYGETLTVPYVPTTREKNGKRYLFAGWSPLVIERVTEDAVYQALYLPQAADATTPNTGHENDRLLRVYLPLGGALAAGGTATCLLLRRRRRRRLPHDNEHP